MKKKKILKIIGWVALGLLAVGVVISFVFSDKIFGANTVFVAKESWSSFGRYMYSKAIPASIRAVQIIVIAAVASIILSLLAKITFESKKTITVALLLLNLLKWIVAIASVFLIMGAWGADTTLMLASAGVLTLIIGLGAQSLIADILAGIFIVFEGEFQVGDIVIIDSWRGEVKEIGMRTTKLVDAGGNIKIVNNSEIRTIINQTQELSVAKTYVSISYGTRIEAVEAVIADNIQEMKEKIPYIVEGPFYMGVSELGESGVVLLFTAKCKEADYYQCSRDLNRQVKIMFDDNGIEIPFNQLVIHQEDGTEDKSPKPTKKEIKKAEDFNEEQKELSKDINEE